jgi:quercetin dioxygenase-like cupin family protein
MDPMKVSANMHKLVKDTLNIRAMIFTAKPGESTPKHAHPDHAIYVLEGGQAEFTEQDGTKQVRELGKGMSRINPATTHSFKNVGKTTIKVLVVEVKRPAQ